MTSWILVGGGFRNWYYRYELTIATIIKIKTLRTRNYPSHSLNLQFDKVAEAKHTGITS
ncbi:hypothetical protein CSE6_028_43600 [Comamonas sp. E6]|nr:hypothetical protein CSE6_028_43600 [Comamonas sp. E6]